MVCWGHWNLPQLRDPLGRERFTPNVMYVSKLPSVIPRVHCFRKLTVRIASAVVSLFLSVETAPVI